MSRRPIVESESEAYSLNPPVPQRTTIETTQITAGDGPGPAIALEHFDEARFARFTRLVQQIFDTAGAMITLADGAHQRLLSRVGIAARQMPRTASLCRFAMATDEVFVIENVHDYPAVHDCPLVRGAPYIRFYAGVALHGPNGAVIGTLAVFDDRPHTFDTRQQHILGDVARLVGDEFINHVSAVSAHERLSKLVDRHPALPVASREIAQTQIDGLISHARATRRSLAMVHLSVVNLPELELCQDPDVIQALIGRWLAALRTGHPDIVHLLRLSDMGFVGVLDRDGAPEDVLALCESIRRSAQQLDLTPDPALKLNVRCGASLYPEHGECAAELITKARLAHCQPRGEYEAVLFNETVGAQFLRDSHMRHRFEEALADGALYFHWQPIFDNEKLDLAAFELLARWDDAKYGAISPTEFIPIADADAQLRRALVIKALDTVCAQLAIWDNDGRAARPRVSINIPGGEFYRPDFASIVEYAIKRYGIDGNRLVLELTESSLIADFDATARTMALLSPLGVRIAIDDFGSGYSSIAYLTKLPLSFVKIDKGVVQRIERDESARRLFQGIIELAHGQGLATIAEGVETATQLEIVRAMNCEYTQGFLLGRPAPAQSLASLLSRFCKDMITKRGAPCLDGQPSFAL